jgi:hypothetical protein
VQTRDWPTYGGQKPDDHYSRSRRSIPHPGEAGYETWPKDAWLYSGAVNNWTGMALDDKRGIPYAPTGPAASDFYGADRVGQDAGGDWGAFIRKAAMGPKITLQVAIARDSVLLFVAHRNSSPAFRRHVIAYVPSAKVIHDH